MSPCSNPCRPARTCSTHPLLWPIALGLALLAGRAEPAAATTLRPLDLDGLVSSASDIVVARVESVHPRWTHDHRGIITEVHVVVEDRVKGEPGASLTLLTPGGEVDGVRVTVDAAPEFRVGERCVVFATRTASGPAHVFGMAQGKFEVSEDAVTGAARVQRRAAGFGFNNLMSLSAASEAHPPTIVSLEEFLSAVRERLRPTGGR